MSRIVRKQLFTIWESIREMQSKLEDMVQGQRYEEVRKLLADCQDEAIFMGNQIEAVYGEGYAAVHCLEEYCESLYHIAEYADDTEDRAGYRALADRKLGEVKEKMEEEIADRMEIAFFPSKASMWDCLESIYQAAIQDDDCEVYCVSVPYYDKKPDGTRGTFHGESGGYPENVRMTGWQEYEFELRKPDIIYLDHLYDGQESAEWAEERFYADNLRQYTEQLVYVPYFPMAGGKTEQFCLPQGVFYVDKIIVHADSIREQYIKEYKASAKKQGKEVSEALLEAKILTLGSPRVDKIWENGEVDSLLPEEWKRMIWKPDGSRKKVILYNTCINAFLTEGTRLLEKMENVFAVFRKRQTEAVLWWRPQSMIRDMLKKVRPELWDTYMDLVKRYQEGKWGIYDDTDDLARALAVTDACYGDWSTVVWEYENCGKPVMIQKSDAREGADSGGQPLYENLSFYDMLQEENECWVFNNIFNGIFKINAQNCESEYIGRAEREAGCKELYRQILPWHEWLILIPETARNVVFYNRATHEMEYVSMLETESKGEEARVSGAYIYKDVLWIFSRYLSRKAVVICLRSRQVYYKNVWPEDWLCLKLTVKEPYFGTAAVTQDDFWLPIADTGKIVRYHFADGEAEIFELKDSKCRISSVDAACGRLWLTFSDTTGVMEWDPVTGEESRHYIDVEWDRKENPFSGIIPLEDSRYIILPAGADDMLLGDGNEWKRLEYPCGFRQNYNLIRDWKRCYSYKRNGNKIFIFPAFGNMLLIYDMEKEVLEGKICAVPEGWCRENIIKEHVIPYFMQKYLEERKAVHEEQEDDLANFISCLVGNYVEGAGMWKKSIGMRIHRFFKEI